MTQATQDHSKKDGVFIENLTRVFSGVRAVDSISFSFRCGQVHGFIGPNGAGKTTTMRMLSTIDFPDGGDAFIMGWSICRHPDRVRRHIGFVPDWFAGFGATTVHEYLDFFARSCGVRGRERIRRVGEIEDFTGLTPLREKLVSSLSRGMQQRLTLGRALVNDPDVLLMDEPAANLDPRARIELRELVKALAEQGKAVFISSHILPELAEMCDSVTIIDKGKILASGDLSSISKTLRPRRTLAVRALCDPDRLEQALMETPDVLDVFRTAEGFRFTCDCGDLQISSILKYLLSSGIPVYEYKLLHENLEDLFMEITDVESSSLFSSLGDPAPGGTTLSAAISPVNSNTRNRRCGEEGNGLPPPPPERQEDPQGRKERP